MTGSLLDKLRPEETHGKPHPGVGQIETPTSSSYTKYSAYVFLGIEQHYRS
jgi:hypothetical protein